MANAEAVIQLIEGYSCKQVAEIGVLKAVLARNVYELCSLDAYYLIDPWKPYSGEGAGILADITNWEEICQRVYSHFWGHDEVHIIRLESVRAAALFEPESLDLVFIDADHIYEEVKQDIGAWLPIVKPGGILSGDDYGVYPGVKKAVDECFGKVLHLPHGAWYIEK